jgi:hypothetical protein
MLAASRGFCFLSGWSGRLWGPWGLARSELWPRLFGGDLGGYPNDVFYAFGWLYARGFRPEVRYRWLEISHDLGIDEAEEGILSVFERYTSLTARVRRVIAEYVREHSRGGRFRQASRQCQGCLLWQSSPSAKR